ncbi:hypothetical protein [Rhizobium rhizophilum]|uniref:hypothetical protein n=1 Tax=Rhizobium rhizophilum TaxID=1850373 RepID=UPI001F2FE7C6|nr:hypothetical protein [Rhizobium rhizophilum]
MVTPFRQGSDASNKVEGVYTDGAGDTFDVSILALLKRQGLLTKEKIATLPGRDDAAGADGSSQP